jgi:hypothetical protein
VRDIHGKAVVVGDVIQILSDAVNPTLNSCFGVVDHVGRWEIIAVIYGISNGLYAIPLASNQFQWIGRAAYIRKA